MNGSSDHGMIVFGESRRFSYPLGDTGITRAAPCTCVSDPQKTSPDARPRAPLDDREYRSRGAHPSAVSRRMRIGGCEWARLKLNRRRRKDFEALFGSEFLRGNHHKDTKG